MLKLLATLSQALVSAALCALCALCAVAPRETASAWLPVPPAQDTPARICGADPACLRQRFLRIDAASIEAIAPDLGLVELPGAALRPLYPYDLRRFSSAITPTRLGHQPDEVLAVRLVLSEVGPDRLLHSRYGLREAVAVLQTVMNRLNPRRVNPMELPGMADYPGCGAEGRFARCVNAQQFHGLLTAQALRPAEVIPEAALGPAIDRALLAWLIVRAEAIPDLTGGATRFAHRCGGRVYGAPASRCDTPEEWRGGASALTGPLVLLAPSGLGPGGVYRHRVSAQIHFERLP